MAGVLMEATVAGEQSYLLTRPAESLPVTELLERMSESERSPVDEEDTLLARTVARLADSRRQALSGLTLRDLVAEGREGNKGTGNS
jgi:hypothetical protein